MKQLFPVFILLVLWSSCTEDDGPVFGNDPTSTISSTAETIEANGSFMVNLVANDGDSPLNTLTIQKDGANVASSNITINGSAAAANPILLFGTDKTSFSYDITIQTDLAAGTSANYTFIVDAENGDNTVESVIVDVPAPMIPPTLEFTNPGNWEGIMPGSILPNDPIVATQTDALLSTFAAYEDGVLMEASRLYFGATVFTENPRTLTTDEQDGFNADLGVRAHNEADTRTYMYILTDVNGLSDTASYTVTVFAGTPIDSTKVNLSLSNSAGPAGQGGVNLITGEETGSNDPGAHLVDRGIDTDLPAETNWLQIIGAGTATQTLKSVTAAVDYASISTKEEIQDIFDDASAVDVTTTDTDRIEGGELLVLETKSGAFVLIQVEAVTPKTTDNSDFYTLNAKF